MIRPSHRILLADDDLEVRRGVAELLHGLGLEVLQASTGLEAVELVRAERLHGALLDMYMPGCTGIEAVSLLLRERQGLPCIVYSGRWSPVLEQEVLAVGAYACLKKPVDPGALRQAVRAALRLEDDSPGRN